MQFDIDCIFQGLGDRGAIYISNSEAAKNLRLLQQLSIGAVLTAAKGRKIEYPVETILRYLYLQIQDTEEFPIHQYFDQSYEFIEQARKSTNILIHCHLGASRSVTLAIAYLIKKYQYSFKQILTLIKRRRNKVLPNPGFVKVLKQFSLSHGISSSQQKSKSRKKRNHSRSFSYNKKQIISGLSQLKIQPLELSHSISSRTQSVFQESPKIKSFERQSQKQDRHSRELQQFEEIQLGKIKQQRNNIEEKLQNLRNHFIHGNKKINSGVKKSKLLKKTSYNITNSYSPFKQGRQMQNSDPNCNASLHISEFNNDSKTSRFTHDNSAELKKLK